MQQDRVAGKNGEEDTCDSTGKTHATAELLLRTSGAPHAIQLNGTDIVAIALLFLR